MSERVPSDHDAVETHRVPVESIGRTDRPRVVLPDAVDLQEGDVVGMALDGDTYHAAIETSIEGDVVVTHVADNRRVARDHEGENRLAEWIADGSVSLGGSAHLDVVTAGHQYGLRTPGTRVVYTATDSPDSSLSDIARDLDG
ncbi:MULTISPECIES: DUF7112 family protein [Haloarcula]|uniref:Uncharacterized protein n=1 Tax=Haloarcula pellucida TaxID=1427151 RepID=A0A830GNM5_9EURY|nr:MULTISPECIES: hypothetical protein [Halomicroarcula]MBX0349148.1 hypothetical protein [Halomicroarcula pellucida]MDS0279259.1 hypothetical protein [Halomicroarcula sp. S1AR25-4]QIO21613.1 hypothetical protein G9465_04285 [Haloarcula sp. JP-L23]GGN99245.1 hypothetical protein GCM10009030_30550 [Halomicroarcula pellucida]